MGADGNLLLMRYEDFLKSPHGEVNVFDIGLKRGKILGVEALSYYSDTNGIDDAEYAKVGLAEREDELGHWMKEFEAVGSTHIELGEKGYWWHRVIVRADTEKELSEIRANPELPQHRRNLEALNWFRANAEKLTVWT